MSEYNPFYIRPDQIQKLKQYPFLESYVKSYIENEYKIEFDDDTECWIFIYRM